MMEIYGPEASGKTTVALHVISEAQEQGGYCVFVDAEHALNKALAESIGVNTENLLLSQPDCGEQALSLVDTLIRSGSVDVIIVDSIPGQADIRQAEGGPNPGSMNSFSSMLLWILGGASSEGSTHFFQCSEMLETRDKFLLKLLTMKTVRIRIMTDSGRTLDFDHKFDVCSVFLKANKL
ncbi:hypothetical protein Ahy_A02g009183 isoform B [Arachis hypogaea]|uniref:RecA family profile 1 domain-containing protein n=1 Tax=Arachis hypogaea TaxID=3818 RepID=A0A445EFZ6_ARAHY|nr:hypothetical protein Ahy_A02g009183 isoform B [Arachis hypogaea]